MRIMNDIPDSVSADLLSFGKNNMSECIVCVGPVRYYDPDTKQCEGEIYPRDYPLYSYVYTYENKTTTGNITYPEYDITTTKWNQGEEGGEEEWVEQPDGETCPCDLT